jgi:hypothetical protein
VPISAYVIPGSAADDSINMGQITLARAGTSDYSVLDGSGRNRWGDYSATVIDSANPGYFFTFQEYCKSKNVWGLRITQVGFTANDPTVPPVPPPDGTPSYYTTGYVYGTNGLTLAASFASVQTDAADNYNFIYTGYSPAIAIPQSGAEKKRMLDGAEWTVTGWVKIDNNLNNLV